MKREEFCEVLGDINENYVKEAGANPKAERRRRFKWKVIAACLCLLLAAPLTVFAMDTIQYHAAVDYLRSLGIPVEDLSDYSRTEIKEAVKTMDAGESSLLTEEILNLLPDSGEPIQRPTQVTSEQVRELTPTMTREEVLSFLGDTQDIGSGIYIYIRFLYKGIIIKHNKTEPTYTKTSLFLCEKRRFFMARTEKGVVTTI